jgi:peptidoglycan hydrolase-like protein with peptidoglycan-binding domain
VTEQGRSAWTIRGHACKTRFYRKSENLPADGTGTGTDAEAVRLGVKAIQVQVNRIVFIPAGLPGLRIDGLFGVATRAAVQRAQEKLGLVSDGVVGRKTFSAMIRAQIDYYARSYEVDPAILYGQIGAESSFDPGAVGYAHPADRGLVQINTETHTDVTVEEAHDTAFALDWSANRLANATLRYAGKGDLLQTQCVILQHNSPSAADWLYRTGTYNSPTAEAYVVAVVTAGLEW